MISRRSFVGGTALVSIGATVPSLLKGAAAFALENPAYAEPVAGRALVLVQLAGGNDGLNTVVPAADGGYRSARRTLGVVEESVVPIGEGFGLHPGLAALQPRWANGQLAVVHGVGYPRQDYSHFKSMAIWQAGDPELRKHDGWLGRTLEQLEDQEHDPFLGFNIGTSTPPELRTETLSIPSVQNLADYAFRVGGRPAPKGDPRTATLMKLYEQVNDARYGLLLEATAEGAAASSALLARAAASYRPAVAYPRTPFGEGLSLLASAITGGLGMRVGHITLGGFDTHSGQAADHARLMTTLADGLAAFMADLEAQGRADGVLVLTWSEFGRRVEENANGGTDHGAASLMFALGPGVNGGHHGQPLSLTKLIDGGNLAYTTDFRAVYATVLDRWFGVPSEPLLGARWDLLNFLPAT